jgi:hypothetical protein
LNTAIFAVHATFVFFVPALFGWVVLRHLVREHDILILIPGSIIVGLTALIVLVNESRYVLEMPQALWFSYKALFLSSLVVRIFGREPRGKVMLHGLVDSHWRLWLVLAGTLTVGFYFGVPASSGFLDDAWWGHYPMAVQIQTIGHFPIPCPFAPDDPLYYHSGPDILASSLAFLLLMPVQQGFALTIAVLAPCAFLLIFALTLRLARSYFSALAAACFVLVGGNLRFINLFGGHLGNAVSRLQVFNSQTVQGLLQLMFTPSHALGIPLTFAVLVVFRHLLARSTWALAATLGFLLGTLTFVAEWYFIPLWGALALCIFIKFAKVRTSRARAGNRRLSILVAPLAIALAVGLFSNTYFSGYFSYFWMRNSSFSERAFSRQIVATLRPEPTLEQHKVQSGKAAIGSSRVNSTPIVDALNFEPPSASIHHLDVKWNPPALIPLSINFAHLGQVPSWNNAGSDGGSWVSILSPAFLLEALPVISLGIPFGVWWWRRSRNLLVLAIVFLAVSSLIPPVFLEWGYRSTDFLRFLSGSFSFSALLLGCFAGDLLRRNSWSARSAGWVVFLITMANAVGLGVLGLIPGTLAAATEASYKGIALSTVANAKPVQGSVAQASPTLSHEEAFERIAHQLDGFLFPIAKGRDRAIVIVPISQLPPLQVFPEWLKLSTLSRVLLPVGWHWNDSLYAAYYRRAVSVLDENSVSSLGARWVIVTNLWDYKPPAAVVRALEDRSRFVPANTFREGPYYLVLYRAF